MTACAKKETIREKKCTSDDGEHREIRDMHDHGKHDCCITCNKVFDKKTGELVGYRDMKMCC